MKDEKSQIQRAKEIAMLAASTLDNKKGMDVTTLEVGEQTVLADYFVLATGTSNTHVRALADEVEFKLREELNVEPTHIEGASGNAWTLLDYGCVVIHVFTTQARDFYKLERLWSGNEIKLEGGIEE
ncbi:MAG: ribosome silencing factor [Clostridia bacterium]|jgi:ribosome-associated protein|nr:ribosome silencing factor [Clostridia bacterium]MBQ5837204.1 ribosome silencing factor [Clostridia bacterium]